VKQDGNANVRKMTRSWETGVRGKGTGMRGKGRRGQQPRKQRDGNWAKKSGLPRWGESKEKGLALPAEGGQC